MISENKSNKKELKRNWFKYKCTQCGKPMNPIERMIGKVCKKCCNDNRKKVFNR